MILIKHNTTNEIVAVESTDGYEDWIVVDSNFDESILATHKVNEDLSTEEVIWQTYADKRRLEYPPLEDLADAIYWSNNGNQLLLESYLDKCAAVKLKYPKPE